MTSAGSDRRAIRLASHVTLASFGLLLAVAPGACGGDGVVDAETGIVRVTITGLQPGFTSAGSAVITGSGIDPITIDLPAQTTGQATVPVGTYHVVYTPPDGYALAQGQSNELDVTVAADETVDVDFAVVETSTPAGVAFHSDWSTALGTGDDAVLDIGKELPWDRTSGNGDLNEVVVAAPELDFPTGMVNVYKNVAEYSGNPGQAVFTDQLRLSYENGHIPIPDVGGDLYYRWYQRYVVPDAIDPEGARPHTVQDGPASSQQNWSWATPIHQDGTFTPTFRFHNTNSYPHSSWESAPLQKNETYRIEIRIHRQSETTIIPSWRLYNSSDELIRSDADMVNLNGTLSFADAPELNLTDAAFFGGFQMGNNGQSWNLTAEDFPFDLWIFGGACVRTDDWCGPYANGI